MDLLNMTIGPKSVTFIRRLNRENVYLSRHGLKIVASLTGWKLAINTKFQHSISKIVPARQEEPQGHKTIVNVISYIFITLSVV